MSDHDEPVAIGCQILRGFITHDGETVWTFRDFRLCATGEEMLQAGASRMLGMFWNGRPNPGVQLEPGIHVVHAGVDGVTGTATIGCGDGGTGLRRRDSLARATRVGSILRYAAIVASVQCCPPSVR